MVNSLNRKILAGIVAAAVFCLTACGITAQKDAMYQEPYRPQFHFSPRTGWMNDPNGLVYYLGEYHLFYQHNPAEAYWGPMHWGHAVSPDLIHWEHLPIALYPDALGPIWSGSAVVDAENSSGLVPGGGLVAIYSYQDQTQGVAYSTDRGRTWQTYQGNPVLPALDTDFRDPKVFWHDATQQWVMVIAARRVIKFFTSDNLLDWQYASEFGDAAFSAGVWEVPDLFPMQIDNQEKWVLIVSINPGGPAGGSGTRYYIGDFDGERFTNDYPAALTWLDYGADNYAGTTWNNAPDGRRLFIGWMSNWLYASDVPTAAWRGTGTIVREFRLHPTPEGIRLAQTPVDTLAQLREPAGTWHDQTIENTLLPLENLHGQTLEIIAEFEPGTALRFGLDVFTSDTAATRVLYNTNTAQLIVVRPTGNIDQMEAVAAAPLKPDNNRIRIHILIDTASLEVFGNDGLVSITNQVFPEPGSEGVSLFAEGGDVRLVSMEAYHLRSVWPEND